MTSRHSMLPGGLRPSNGGSSFGVAVAGGMGSGGGGSNNGMMPGKLTRRSSSVMSGSSTASSFRAPPLASHRETISAGAGASLSVGVGAGADRRRQSGLFAITSPQVDAKEARLGDLVEVPGGWHGEVVFVGGVEGRDGIYLGVDLIDLDRDKGRNDGTYKGRRYFTTRGPTSGLFVPQGRCRIVSATQTAEAGVTATAAAPARRPGAALGDAGSRRVSEDYAGTNGGTWQGQSGVSSRVVSQDYGRPSSRTLHIRPNSRMRSTSGEMAPLGGNGYPQPISPPTSHLFASIGPGVTAEPRPGHRRLDSLTARRQSALGLCDADAQNAAMVQQKLLNENARLKHELDVQQGKLGDLRKAKALQAQEMDDLQGAVAELQHFIASESANGTRDRDLSNSSVTSPSSVASAAQVDALQAALHEREAQILALHREADGRRDEFRKVTHHQQETIDELKRFHDLQIDELERKQAEVERSYADAIADARAEAQAQAQAELQAQAQAQARAVSPAAAGANNVKGGAGGAVEGFDAAETMRQLAELEAMCEEMQRNSAIGRQRIDDAQLRIHELERENDRLLDELARVTIEAESAATAVDRAANDDGARDEAAAAASAAAANEIEELRESLTQLEQQNEVLKKQLSARATLDGQVVALEAQLAHARSNVARMEADRAVDAKDAQAAAEAAAETSASAMEQLDHLAQELDREREARKKLEEDYAQLEHLLDRTILQMEEGAEANDDAASVLLPADAGSGVMAGSPMSPDAGEAHANGQKAVSAHKCEYCDEVGHDVLNCAKVLDGALSPVKVGTAGSDRLTVSTPTKASAGKATNGQLSPTKSLSDAQRQHGHQQQQLKSPPRENRNGERWCENCLSYGEHFTEDCPNADLEF